jgi:hypothetical protein
LAQDSKTNLYKILFFITILSLVLYGVLFYMFLNRMLRLEVLLGIISVKFVLTISWTYWLRHKEKQRAKHDEARPNTTFS